MPDLSHIRNFAIIGMAALENLTRRHGFALVLSGPSGAGKSTVVQRVLAADPLLRFSVSCTTRQPRPGETDGVDYHFLGREDFAARVAAGAFLEHATVHGNSYGTLKASVRDHLEAGLDVLLDIDVQGADQIRALGDADPYWRAVTSFVFLGPPSVAELESRLRRRAADSEDVIRRRLANARGELQAWRRYPRVIVNRDVEQAVSDLAALVRAERLAVSRLPTTAPWDAP